MTILTALVQQIGRAPRERWNLFSRYFAYTYNREIERNTYASPLLADFRTHIEKIHMRVALLLQVEAEREGRASARMSRPRLEEVIAAVLDEDEIAPFRTESITEDDIAENRKTLVKEIAIAAEQRLVFLVEPEPGKFGFEIRSLQEFLAAWALTSGRDSEIEARLIQVANAPMFRNTLLFAASRLFSDGLPLRDVFADRICVGLNSDRSDNGARLSLAGGTLALELLEEGAVLAQPKRARSLMGRAISILALPAAPEHARLGRIANLDTAAVLLAEINQLISGSGSVSDLKLSSGAAWACLIEMTNRGDKAAIDIAESHWRSAGDHAAIFKACAAAEVALGDWITRMIEADSKNCHVLDFLDFHSYRSESLDKSTSWVFWLISIFSRNVVQSRMRRFHGNLPFLPVQEPDVLETPTAEMPPSWSPWIRAAMFMMNPSQITLGAALSSIADQLPPDQQAEIKWRSSWPLSVCISAAESQDDLRNIATRAYEGKLGDFKDWTAAESRWSESIDLSACVKSISDASPWTKQLLKVAPPFMALPAWFYVSRAQPGQNTAAATFLPLLAGKFRKIKSKPIKAKIAEICLRLSYGVTAKTAPIDLSFDKWLAATPMSISALIPKPRSLSLPAWRTLLDVAKAPEEWATKHVYMLSKAIVDSHAHPVVLKDAVRSLDGIYRFDMHRHRGDTLVVKAAAILREKTIESPSEKAYADLLLVFFGAYDFSTAGAEDALVRAISDASDQDDALWATFLNISKSSEVPRSSLISILTSAIALMDVSNPAMAIAVQLVRDTLQGSRSGLDTRSVWTNLSLPLPTPQVSKAGNPEESLPVQPIWLDGLVLKNVGRHRTLTLSPLPPSNPGGQWTVIIGPNGTGKTTILRSIALALRDVRNPSIWPKGAFSNLWQRIDHPDRSAINEAEIAVKLSDGIDRITRLHQDVTLSVAQTPQFDSQRHLPLFAYGCRRGSALGGATRQVSLGEEDGPEIATLFDDGADLIHAETWLLQLEGDAPKNERSARIFEATIGALRTLLHLETVVVKDRRVWVTEPGRPQLPFSSLSDGYLTSAGWFLDLVARWLELLERFGKKVEPNFLEHMCGLVLIDEIDLHLHPQLQIEIISRTRRLLPNMSFIVTTHNPVTLVGAQAHEISILSHNDGDIDIKSGTETPMFLTGGQIYQRYFDLHDIYPNGLGRSLQRYSFLSGYSSRNEEEESELQSLLNELRAAGIDPGWDVVPISAS
ncbi:AAA family ATPase [Paraburkholderia aspalathi]|uniref:AAA family ATPase n=1 Tax=Paraburkholderia aspalathi TaxID=1324617 RepID=UPI00190C3958|nr:AAA family ATPase [Paraburkholderia aspalathi]MBK3824249.1 AAA family ATPase [Paraburkholderia aspalathi]MBK3836095.1 AAA family ATPase [Paraburkholderia aspalathi]MBK3865864.1 AAA family ATPase [Paraburkholderia aspalathi]